MIGGTDTIVARAADEAGRRRILEVVSEFWPAAIIDDARSQQVPVPVCDASASALPVEILVYETEDWRRSWESLGATDDNADRLLHIVLGATSVTCVVDERSGSQTAAIAERIRLALESVAAPLIHDAFFGEPLDPAAWVEAA